MMTETNVNGPFYMTCPVVKYLLPPRRGGSIIGISTSLDHGRNQWPHLQGPIFEPIRNDPLLFRSMRVEGGTITWPNGADIDPDVLYHGLKPAWASNSAASNCESRFL